MVPQNMLNKSTWSAILMCILAVDYAARFTEPLWKRTLIGNGRLVLVSPDRQFSVRIEATDEGAYVACQHSDGRSARLVTLPQVTEVNIAPVSGTHNGAGLSIVNGEGALFLGGPQPAMVQSADVHSFNMPPAKTLQELMDSKAK